MIIHMLLTFREYFLPISKFEIKLRNDKYENKGPKDPISPTLIPSMLETFLSFPYYYISKVNNFI